MKLTILGSGGNTPIPMPTCQCRICNEARQHGIPYARNGNSMFYHDENILFDTPEDIFDSLNRENIERVDAVFLSHYHFDHTLGLRVLQSFVLRDKPVQYGIDPDVDLVMSQATYDSFLEPNKALSSLAETWSNLRVVEDGDTLTYGDTTITCMGSPMEPGGGPELYSYLLEKDEKQVMLSQDETKFLDVERVPELDVWIRETGLFKSTPDGDPTMSEALWDEQIPTETTFEETLHHVTTVEPDKAVLTEIEELYQRSHDDLNELAAKHDTITFAHDGMNVTV